jgi:8-oxo-dGTP pyrophosphatase MutT (NUDIX family)
MSKVAKAVLIAPNDRYLLLHRSDHPTFGTDPDLPGGTWEKGESLIDTVVREVKEEIDMDLDRARLQKIYEGNAYSVHGTHYELFSIEVRETSAITLSWEHSRYQWLEKSEFITQSRHAKDTFMHMVADVIEGKV